MRGKRRIRAFTLIELLIVVLIIGILAAVGIPQYFRVIEKGRVAEITAYAQGLRTAQDRYCMRGGSYSGDANQLDLTLPALKYFANSVTLTGGDQTAGWEVTFKRNSSPATPSPYPSTYSVVFNSITANFTCSNTSVLNDLLPR